MRIAILALAVLVAGCTTSQRSRMADSEMEQARSACQAAYDSGRITTRTARAKCINDAENRYAASSPGLAQQQALRLDLARKVDAGKLTQAQADAQYASGMHRITGR
ncbi:hypothetical protein [Kaistia adipata]|uniref:hypothetical protein n=1 Tax=Kaistia adipata TaxID=166954 RepID=UPI00048C607A|nr:hypothetical protein [Kaistia adipata]